MPSPLAQWASLAPIFAAHRARAYADLAAACATDAVIGSLGPPLVVLHAIRLAHLQGRARDPWSGDFAAFADDLGQHRDLIAAAVRRGVVQFTEPLRLADILPGYLLAARRYPGLPLRIVDVGACAGLQIAPECFAIDYPHARWCGARAAATLESDLDVPEALLQTDWTPADRVGIDLAPVGASDPDSGNTLRSFAWPGDAAREPRLLAALAALAPSPPPLRAGSALDLLPVVLGEWVSRRSVTVVLDSASSHYWPPLEGLRLGRLLDRMAARGPLLLLTRGGPVANTQGLSASIRLVDLSRPWRCVYAATDLLSERTEWVAPASAWAREPGGA